MRTNNLHISVSLIVILASAASAFAAFEQSDRTAASRGPTARRLLQQTVVQCPLCHISCSNVQCNQCDCSCYEVQCNQPGAQNIIRVTNAPPPAPAASAAAPAAEDAPATVTAIIDGEPTEVALIDEPAAAGSTGLVRGIAEINGTETEVLLRPATDEEAAAVQGAPAAAESPAPSESAAEPAAESGAAATPEAATTTVTIDGQQQEVVLVEGPAPSSAAATVTATITVDGQPQEVTLAPVENAAAATTAVKEYVLVSAPERVKQVVELVPIEEIKEVVVVEKPEKPDESEKPKDEKEEYVYVEAKPVENKDDHPSKVVHINIYTKGHHEVEEVKKVKEVIEEKEEDKEDDSSSDEEADDSVSEVSEGKVHTETVQVVTVQKCPGHCKWYLKTPEKDRPEDCYGCITTAHAKELAKQVAEEEGLDYVFE